MEGEKRFGQAVSRRRRASLARVLLRRCAECAQLLVHDKPSAGLVGLAEENDARMIIVGSYGEPPLKGALIGSTAHKLLHLSERPVLVVRG